MAANAAAMERGEPSAQIEFVEFVFLGVWRLDLETPAELLTACRGLLK